VCVVVHFTHVPLHARRVFQPLGGTCCYPALSSRCMLSSVAPVGVNVLRSSSHDNLLRSSSHGNLLRSSSHDSLHMLLGPVTSAVCLYTIESIVTASMKTNVAHVRAMKSPVRMIVVACRLFRFLSHIWLDVLTDMIEDP
jgi:hypothetical protein